MAWTRVCAVTDVADGAGLKIARQNPIAVFRVGEEFFATDDTCTHAKFSLADGYVEEAEIVCALHEARFCLRTGQVCLAAATSRCARIRFESKGARFLWTLRR